MDTLVLHGHLGRPAHILDDGSARVRAAAHRFASVMQRCISRARPGNRALRATILVVGYPIVGIAVVCLSALISALAAAVLSAIYMVIVACIIVHMAITSLAANEC